jgi:ATP synthase protein I
LLQCNARLDSPRTRPYFGAGFAGGEEPCLERRQWMCLMGDDRKSSPSKSSPGKASFDERLKAAARVVADRDKPGRSRSSAYHFGFRLAADLLAGVLGGFAIGWGLDYLLGTSPWFLLVFILLGMAAGILNVIRAATSMEAKRHLDQTSGEGLPSVRDDED